MVTINNYDSIILIVDTNTGSPTYSIPKTGTWIEKSSTNSIEEIVFYLSNGNIAARVNWTNISPALASTYDGTFLAITNMLTVTNSGKISTFTSNAVTLPAAGATYADGKVIGGNPAENFLFQDVVDLNGGGGYITSAELLLTDVTGDANGVTTNVRLWSVAPTAVVDNASWTRGSGAAGYEGKVEMPALAVEGATFSTSEVSNARVTFNCASNSKNLYAQIEATSAYIRAAVAVTATLIIKVVKE